MGEPGWIGCDEDAVALDVGHDLESEPLKEKRDIFAANLIILMSTRTLHDGSLTGTKMILHLLDPGVQSSDISEDRIDVVALRDSHVSLL